MKAKAWTGGRELWWYKGPLPTVTTRAVALSLPPHCQGERTRLAVCALLALYLVVEEGVGGQAMKAATPGRLPPLS